MKYVLYRSHLNKKYNYFFVASNDSLYFSFSSVSRYKSPILSLNTVYSASEYLKEFEYSDKDITGTFNSKQEAKRFVRELIEQDRVVNELLK